MIVAKIIEAVLTELLNADAKHPPMAEMVEGLHTLKCEVAELEREIARKNFDKEEMVKEAIQVAAMGIKFLRDCCDMGQVDEPVPNERSVPIPDRNLRTAQLNLANVGPLPEMSERGREWTMFAQAVLNHIEGYTVPQYGDKGEDRASEYGHETIKEHIGRYRDRIGSGARGHAESKRDFLKMAHYASFGWYLDPSEKKAPLPPA
jgi:hypothetical protein